MYVAPFIPHNDRLWKCVDCRAACFVSEPRVRMLQVGLAFQLDRLLGSSCRKPQTRFLKISSLLWFVLKNEKNHSRCSSQIWINANSHKQKHLCLLLSLPQGKLILLEQRDRGFLMVLGVRLPVCTILGFSFGCQSWRPPLSNARLPQPNPQHSAAKLPGRNGDRPF